MPPAAATQTPAPTRTPSPTPPPTADPGSLVAEFYAVLVPAIRAADADTLVAILHPATLERYGEAACRTQLGGLDDPAFDVVVRGVRPLAAWDYTTDERTTTISGAWAVDADLTANGTTETRELHVALVDGEVRWFTDCGTPLG
jgi:hypothetical protein